MELIKYLNDNFLTRDELLQQAKIKEMVFQDYQSSELMPAASYLLKLDLQSDSFFGEHKEQIQVEYYAKGYTSWLGIIRSLSDKERIYNEFSTRYENAVKRLKTLGFRTENPKMNTKLQAHIFEEWDYFIRGVYGLCTKSGLPEDIASKEFAVILINELSEKDSLDLDETKCLIRAVNLLDDASSLFAPHERLQSSRHRLVDEIRRKFSLPLA